MPRYNLAYCPDDPDFTLACVAAAQKSFAEIQDGYVLAPGAAHPHVTACQFLANEADLQRIWEAVATVAARRIKLVINSTYALLGKAEHADFAWLGLGVTRSSEIVDSQRQISTVLKGQGATPLTKPGDSYWPHLTFARLRRKNAAKAGLFWPEELLSAEPRGFSLTLGLSDENGVYKKRLFPV